MRIIYTILLLSISFSSVSQALPQSGAKDSSNQFKTVCLPVKSVTEVLYVIDGVLAEESALRSLNPSSIESIYILKDSATRIFSCRSLRPVIIVNTRRSINLQITIRDKEEGFVLPGTTVRFISSDGSDTLMYVADSAGQVSRKDLKKGVVYNIYVTATGYKAFTGSVHSIGDGIIQLEREYIIGQEVILSSGLVHRCGRGCGGNLQRRSKECSIQKKQICNASTEVLTEQLEKNSLHIYPNPVRKGQLISVKLAQGYFTSGSIRIHSINGKQLLSVPVSGSQKTGMIQIFMQQGWPPGLYILQLVYANGRVGASEKIIIQ